MISGPLRFAPILKERPWGLETWWISDRPDDQSRVTEGPSGMVGRTLSELDPNDLLGQEARSPFPLLVKTLQAHAWLSIQVHPAGGRQRKSEAWYALKASPDSEILLGSDGPLDPSRLPAGMRRHPLRRGDAVLIPSGVPHAMGPGLILAEIQQNADTTYRLHDWGRTGRELHVEQALEAASQAPLPTPPRPLSEGAITCEAFGLALRILPWEAPGGTCRLVGSAEGPFRISWDSGTSSETTEGWWLLPACLGPCRIEGTGSVLEASPC